METIYNFSLFQEEKSGNANYSIVITQKKEMT